MKPKHGKISIVVAMAVVVVTGLLILGIFGEPIKKAFAAVTDPLLKKIGLGEDGSEKKIVEQELLDNAKKVFDDFKAVIEQCKDGRDLKCGCGLMDFTQLNKYSIMLSSNNKDTKNSFLQLLDSKGLPVPVGDPAPIDPTPIANFPTLPEDIYKDSGKFSDYKSKDNYLRFSIDKLVYGINGDKNEKFKGKMKSIHFSEPELEVTIFNDKTIEECSKKCPAFTFCGDYNKEQCNDCGASRSMDNNCKWIDYDGVADECRNPFKAPALIVKIDTGEDPTEVWDFRLTSKKRIEIGDGIAFNLDDFDHPDPGKECVVMAIRENGDDSPRVWYVQPGSLIKNELGGRLSEELKGTIFHGCSDCGGGSGDFCVSKCTYSFRASPTVIVAYSEYTVGEKPYSTGSNDNCGSFSKTRCPLLDDISYNKYWKPKFDILCDEDGYWNVCTSASVINVEGVKYTCELNKWAIKP